MSREFQPGDVARIRYDIPLGGRPLVVIDPADCQEFCKRVADKLDQEFDFAPADLALVAGAVDEVVEEYANPTPPKPEEPTGRYAVVEDDLAGEWIKPDLLGSHNWNRVGSTKWANYDDIAVVRVLSEGVSDD